MLFTKDGVGVSRVYCPAIWSGLAQKKATVFAFLCERFPWVDAAQWASRFEQRLVLAADGSPLAIDALYVGNVFVHYYRCVEQEPVLPYAESILYQDECIVIADKPHFLPVIPSGPYVRETLLSRLKHKLNLPELSPMHRIDRDTAGLVMFCVQPKHRAIYQNLFRDGKVRKHYHALASYKASLDLALKTSLASTGMPLRIENRLETAGQFMQMQSTSGQHNAITEIAAIERRQSANTCDDVALYTLRPLTGKRHQLRVHMLGLGVPIIGDEIYPVLKPQRDISMAGHAPLQLLAQSLQFIDPLTGHERCYNSQRTLVLD